MCSYDREKVYSLLQIHSFKFFLKSFYLVLYCCAVMVQDMITSGNDFINIKKYYQRFLNWIFKRNIFFIMFYSLSGC